MIHAAARLVLRPWRLRALALCIALLAWLALAVFAPSLFSQADERATDALWRSVAAGPVERRVVIVDIDDASLRRIGPWPWPRATQAKLVQALREQGASVQLYDMVFADTREGDADLARAIAAADTTTPVVLAQVFAINHESAQASGRLDGALPGSACLPPSVPAEGFVANAPALSHGRAGHVTPRLDPDGAVRRVPALVCFDGRNYPALALAGVLAGGGTAAQAPLKVEPGTRPWDPAWTISFPQTPGVVAPLDAQGDVRVPFRRSRQALLSVSAADVLEGRVPQQVLRGTWALVGASAFGLTDSVPTALGGAVSGAEIHAQLISAMLDGQVPFEPRAASALQLGWAAVAIALLLLLAGWGERAAAASRLQLKQALWLPLAGLGLGASSFALHAIALLAAGWWVGWASPALGIMVAGFALGLAEHARSLAEKGRLFRNLASYLPGAVAEQVALAEPTGEISAERRELTVVAADLRNFSAYCEARSPEDAARVLHRFYSTAGAIVEAHGGVVEEMVGDSLIALFNGPRPCEEHTSRALAAARELWVRCSEELPNLPPQGLEPLALGVGVETGVALLGSFGPQGRRVHTVLGQPVTVALRLQELTAELAYPVLVGENAAQVIGVPFDQSDLALKPLGNFLLPGLRHASKVFTLRTLLLPGGPGEQQSLHYLRQQKNLAA